jgi:hypothetical protein
MANANAEPPEKPLGPFGDEADVHHDSDDGPRAEKDGKYELRESDAWNVLGYAFPSFKKWRILMVVFFIQIYINSNASMYSNAVERISEHHHVSMAKARVPQAMFLIAYGFVSGQYIKYYERV